MCDVVCAASGGHRRPAQLIWVPSSLCPFRFFLPSETVQHFPPNLGRVAPLCPIRNRLLDALRRRRTTIHQPAGTYCRARSRNQQSSQNQPCSRIILLNASRASASEYSGPLPARVGEGKDVSVGCAAKRSGVWRAQAEGVDSGHCETAIARTHARGKAARAHGIASRSARRR